MVDERVGLCGACESACESEPSKRFRVLRHHSARMSWHWPLCKLLLHLPLLNNPNYTALPRSATATLLARLRIDRNTPAYPSLLNHLAVRDVHTAPTGIEQWDIDHHDRAEQGKESLPL